MSKKLKAIAVDDEEHCIETLKWELERACPEVELIASTMDEDEARILIEQNDFDILFMDIHLQSSSGIEFVKSLPSFDFEVIFVTAYDKYAIAAFEVAASNYLLKPISGTKLKTAIDRIIEKNERTTKTTVDNIIAELSKSNFKNQRIPFHVQSSIEFVDPEDIILVKGDNNYSTLHFTSGSKLVVSKTLSKVESKLSECGFFRTHKSYLINLRHIVRYVKTTGGYLEMTEGHQVPVSRAKKSSVQELFQ